jgi:hypothetical protein
MNGILNFCEHFFLIQEGEKFIGLLLSIVLLVPVAKNICVFLSAATLPPPLFENVCAFFYCISYCYELDFV